MSKTEIIVALVCMVVAAFIFSVFNFPLVIIILSSLLGGVVGSVVVCYVEEKTKK